MMQTTMVTPSSTTEGCTAEMWQTCPAVVLAVRLATLAVVPMECAAVMGPRPWDVMQHCVLPDKVTACRQHWRGALREWSRL